MESLARVLNQHVLRQMAGSRSFERGEEYFTSGQVLSLTEYEGTIAARVLGAHEYRVKLWVEGDGLGYSCTCPVGDDGAFCKHCVAVGLTWLAEATDKQKPGKARKSTTTMKDVEAYLERQDKDTLVRMLMEQAMDDDRLRERLLMKTARMGPKGLDLATFRRAIDHAVSTGDFIEYGEVWDYAQGIEEVITSIEELLKEGYAAEVIELVEYALDAVEHAIESVDDSDGRMGDVLVHLQELHHTACKAAKPDPEALAKRLFELELRGGSDTFYNAMETYADVLGNKGLAVYRTLVEAEWAHVRTLKPGKDDPDRYGKRFRITHIMETLAQQSGDIEALVAIKSRDLSYPYSYLQIAEVYKQAGQYDQALEWAERGMKAFPNQIDSRLRDFLAEEYHRRKRHDEAMALMWAEFMESPYLTDYQKLQEHADRIGQWPLWREKALSFIRQTLTKAKKTSPKIPWGLALRMDHSELVQIFLWEQDSEAAWREAKEGGCSNDLWMELAARREKEHPEDALPIYQGQIEPTIELRNNEAYQQAVNLLLKVRDLMTRLGRAAEFVAYLEAVRTAHKPKRNLMKLLEQIK